MQYSLSSMNSGQMGWNIEVSSPLRSSCNFHLLLLLANVPTTTMVSIKSLWKFGGGWVVLLFLASSDVKVTKNKKVKIESKVRNSKIISGHLIVFKSFCWFGSLGCTSYFQSILTRERSCFSLHLRAVRPSSGTKSGSYEVHTWKIINDDEKIFFSFAAQLTFFDGSQ